MVIGGGLVGASAAVAMALKGFKVVMVDRHDPDLSVYDDLANWDQRIYAISPNNVAWLEEIGVWQGTDADRICTIQKMQIWGDSHSSRPLVFDAYENNTKDLGVILESNQLLKAAWDRMSQLGVTILTGSECLDLEINDDVALLTLNDKRALEAKLVIAADGGQSWVRKQCGIGTSLHVYDHKGVVANFETELPHHSIARQWFREDGILAWLPLSGNRISMVWSTAKSDELLADDLASLANKVAEAGHWQCGRLKAMTSPAVFSLVKQTADRLIGHRLVLVGDAAHQIHPMVGQGVNLGFRDVIELSRTLDQRKRFEEIGDDIVLRRYERERKSDMLGLGALTHGLYWLFSSDVTFIRRLGIKGMALLNKQNVIKRWLMEQAS